MYTESSTVVSGLKLLILFKSETLTKIQYKIIEIQSMSGKISTLVLTLAIILSAQALSLNHEVTASISPTFFSPTAVSTSTPTASAPTAPVATSSASIAPSFLYPTGVPAPAPSAATAAPAPSTASIAPSTASISPSSIIPNTTAPAPSSLVPAVPAAAPVAPAPYTPTAFIPAIPYAACSNGTVQDPLNGSCVCPASAPYTNSSGWCVACNGN